MKKELAYMLELTNITKVLRINGMFQIESSPIAKNGMALCLCPEGTEPDHMDLRLVYTLKHDGFLFKQTVLESKDVDSLIMEVEKKMRSVLDAIQSKLTTQWKNGYIQGKPVTRIP